MPSLPDFGPRRRIHRLAPPAIAILILGLRPTALPYHPRRPCPVEPTYTLPVDGSEPTRPPYRGIRPAPDRAVNRD